MRVDGVSRTVWLLSREQAKLGHDVTLVVDTPPDQAAMDIVKAHGMKIIQVEANLLTYASVIRRILEREQPEIVHMHSVFVVRQATLGKVLNDMGIPYVITPHGGLAPQVLRRGIVKKTIYALLRERPRFMGAHAVALVTPAEERAVRAFIPNYRNTIRWMPNPVEVENLDPHRWQGVSDKPRAVYLGRFDVLVKGIDILVEIARRVPEVQFDLYGTEDPKTLEWLNRLKQDLPSNVTFHPPIFGADKAKMLAQASIYMQPSRWEGFPVSVAECLYVGVPSAIADTLDLAQLFYQHNLGLVVPLDPPRAAVRIREALADSARLKEWSEAGRKFALDHFHPSAVAAKHVGLYQEVLETVPKKARELPPATPGRLPALSLGKGQLLSTNMRGSLKENVSRAYQRTTHLLGTDTLPRTVVLCYHSVNKSAADLSVDPETFREQMLTLRGMGYSFKGFGDLVYDILRWGPPKHNVACITFDDGFEDNLTQAAPILSELGIPATVFVTSGLMLGDQRTMDHFRDLTRYDTTFLSPDQLPELRKHGIEVGAHTHTHRNLARLTIDQMRDEITRSKQIVEDALGEPVRSFAYPFGKRGIHYNENTVNLVREAGFQGAAAVAFRSVTARNSLKVFEIPRFFVNRSDSPLNFRRKVEGYMDWLGPIQESAPTWLKAVVSPEDKY